jgi:hypothetical protein
MDVSEEEKAIKLIPPSDSEAPTPVDNNQDRFLRP